MDVYRRNRRSLHIEIPTELYSIGVYRAIWLGLTLLARLAVHYGMMGREEDDEFLIRTTLIAKCFLLGTLARRSISYYVSNFHIQLGISRSFSNSSTH